MTTPKLLIIGRDPLCTDAILYHFSANYKITNVPRCLDAITHNQLNVDAVLLIHNPPEEDGIASLKVLKKQNTDIPTFLIGSFITHKDSYSAFRIGVKDVRNLDELDELKETLHQQIQQYGLKKNSLKEWLKQQRNIYLGNIPKEFCGIVSSPNPYSNIPLVYTPTSDLSVQLLGKFRVFVLGKEVEKPIPNKAKALLGYMLMNKRKQISRDLLAKIFWKDTPTEYAKNNLNVTVHTLRKWFQDVDKETNYIISKGNHYEINQNLSIETDLDYFRLACNEAQEMQQIDNKIASANAYFRAYANYRGDFMEGLTQEEWVECERYNLLESFLIVLQKLTEFFIHEQYYEMALKTASKMVYLDNCLENAYRFMMISYWKNGDRINALRQFERCKQALKQELGINVSRRTVELYEEIQKE
jgi:DNA-binding SARP family transcriptional activator/CheY-like chemotaxis protein